MVFNDKALDDMGFADYPESERSAIARQLGDALSLRVGEHLTRGLDDRALDEFGIFMDKNSPAACAWLDKHVPGWAGSEAFVRRCRLWPETTWEGMVLRFGAIKWLELYCPDYKRVVREEISELVEEMRSTNALLT